MVNIKRSFKTEHHIQRSEMHILPAENHLNYSNLDVVKPNWHFINGQCYVRSEAPTAAKASNVARLDNGMLKRSQPDWCETF